MELLLEGLAFVKLIYLLRLDLELEEFTSMYSGGYITVEAVQEDFKQNKNRAYSYKLRRNKTMQPDRIEQLKVPKLKSLNETGNILRVIGIYLDDTDLWINTASEDNKLVNMKLTRGLEAWGFMALTMVDTGMIPFPCDIEFGEYDGRQYAEIL